MKYAVKEATERARKFHGRNPTGVSRVELPQLSALVCLGEAVAIEYRSDKDVPRLGGKKMRVYRHKIGPGVKVYTDPKGQCVLVMGGKFRVTDWMRG